MNEPYPTYRSYLLRLWRMDNAGQPVWRVGLQEPGSELQIYFESLEALWAYLAIQLGIGGKNGAGGNGARQRRGCDTQ